MNERLSHDGVARALLQQSNLKVSVVVAGTASRVARAKHSLQLAAASLLGQAMTGAALMASLQKDNGRVNLQLECDGVLRGLFADAHASGTVRGYVKNPYVEVELAEGAFRWRGALGNKGFVSVLRDVGEGEFYRSSVELTEMSIADDLNKYFEVSEQVATHLAIDVVAQGDEPLSLVAGVLVQAMPDGDSKKLLALSSSLPQRLHTALTALQVVSAETVLASVLDEAPFELTMRGPLEWKCTCSKEKVLGTLASLGRAEVQDILDTTGSTSVTCQFCSTKHEVTFQDLIELLETFGATPRN